MRGIERTFTYRCGDLCITCMKNEQGGLTAEDLSGKPGLLTIPAEVKGMPLTALSIDFVSAAKCMTEIRTAPENPYFYAEDSVLYDRRTKTLLCCPTRKDGVFRVPDGTRAVECYAFSGCAHLTEVYLPDSVQEIGDNAFSGCRSLRVLRLPDGLTQIPPLAVQGCSGLTTLSLPDGLVRIGEAAFRKSGLTALRIPDSVREIGPIAFFGCLNLKQLNLPPHLDYIGWNAFGDCGLKEISVPDGEAGERVTEMYDGSFSHSQGKPDQSYLPEPPDLDFSLDFDEDE